VAYLVNITARAERDLAALYDEIRAEDSPAARRWYAGLKKAILDLENLPYCWPATHESRSLRHILYGRKPRIYRVIYRVLARRNQVDVLHIRCGARRQFKPSDLRY
jgi:plasmid stabilization system protein ParE